MVNLTEHSQQDVWILDSTTELSRYIPGSMELVSYTSVCTHTPPPQNRRWRGVSTDGRMGTRPDGACSKATKLTHGVPLFRH